jgi:hypothetical protein
VIAMPSHASRSISSMHRCVSNDTTDAATSDIADTYAIMIH